MKKTVYKEYIPHENGSELKIEVYYSIGGMNHFTSRNESRGFYLSVCPVKREFNPSGYVMESYEGFSGIKTLLHQCNRYSKSAENKALSYLGVQRSNLIGRFRN